MTLFSRKQAISIIYANSNLARSITHTQHTRTITVRNLIAKFIDPSFTCTKVIAWLQKFYRQRGKKVTPRRSTIQYIIFHIWLYSYMCIKESYEKYNLKLSSKTEKQSPTWASIQNFNYFYIYCSVGNKIVCSFLACFATISFTKRMLSIC